MCNNKFSVDLDFTKLLNNFIFFYSFDNDIFITFKLNRFILIHIYGFTATAKGSSLIIKLRNCDGFHKLVEYCNDSDLECHTWAPVIPAHSKCLFAIYIILYLLKI